MEDDMWPEDLLAVPSNEGGETEQESTLKCLRTRYLEFRQEQKENPELLTSFCPAIWDSVYCWPYTAPNVTLTRSCVEVMMGDPEVSPAQLALVTGNAIRICTENGTWKWGNWTNYTECLESLGDDERFGTDVSNGVVNAVRWILFLGSIFSFITLTVSLLIFYHFKCLRCNRVTVHIHFMVSLALRFALLLLITEPFIFNRSENYRNVNWICKGVTCVLMYATVSSIHWMFIQGHYLHSRLTSNIFDTGTPFRIYYFIGWVFPFILIVIWAVVMETYHQAYCWQNYSKINYVWILVGPMIGALLVNLLFLVNIMRILLTKIQRANTSSDATQFIRAVKATAILFPLLGINNLLFVYNPGGGYENFYMISNTLIQASQGIFVSFLYCFFSGEVRQALRREYRRFTARRPTNSFRSATRRPRSSNNPSVVFLTPKAVHIRHEEGQDIAPVRSFTPSPEIPHAGHHELQTSQTHLRQLHGESTQNALFSATNEVTLNGQNHQDNATQNLNRNVIPKFSESSI